MSCYTYQRKNSYGSFVGNFSKKSLLMVQLDAGVHPAYNGIAALPFYDEIDMSTVDILLISQLSGLCSFVMNLIGIVFTWIMLHLSHM